MNRFTISQTLSNWLLCEWKLNFIIFQNVTHIRRRIDRPNVLLHAIYGFIEVVAVVMRNINNNQDERIHHRRMLWAETEY